MPERDENQQAVRNVDKATDSEPVRGEELFESEEAKRLLREAKERAKSDVLSHFAKSRSSRPEKFDSTRFA